MKDGKWVSIHENFKKHLPSKRPYSPIEAIFSIQCDYKHKNPVTLTGYAKLWQWSPKKVRVFLDKIGAKIVYPEDTKKKQNQKGMIWGKIRNRKGTEKGMIKLCIIDEIEAERNRKGTEKELKRNRSGATTMRIENRDKEKEKKTSCLTSKRSDTYSVQSFELAELLKDKLYEAKPDRRKITEHQVKKWAEIIDRMTRLDKRKPKKIAKVINWLFTNNLDNDCNFVVESATSLRKKFDRIEIAIKKEEKYII